jgi:ribose transport system ATP-binding protein
VEPGHRRGRRGPLTDDIEAPFGRDLVSSEMEEILALADRALVMHEGRLAGGLARAELTEENVIRLAAGGGAERMTV